MTGIYYLIRNMYYIAPFLKGKRNPFQNSPPLRTFVCPRVRFITTWLIEFGKRSDQTNGSVAAIKIGGSTGENYRGQCCFPNNRRNWICLRAWLPARVEVFLSFSEKKTTRVRTSASHVVGNWSRVIPLTWNREFFWTWRQRRQWHLSAYTDFFCIFTIGGGFKERKLLPFRELFTLLCFKRACMFIFKQKVTIWPYSSFLTRAPIVAYSFLIQQKPFQYNIS